MVSYDVASLFTNIPLSETIDLAVNAIFESNTGLDLIISKTELKELFVWDFPTLCQERRYFFVCIRGPRVCDVVSIGRERTLGMSVCVWRPFIMTRLLFSWFDQFTR